MKSEKEIIDKVKELEKQKIQLAEMGKYKNSELSVLVDAVNLLDKQINLLKWVLGKM
jgi:hypothetical protein